MAGCSGHVLLRLHRLDQEGPNGAARDEMSLLIGHQLCQTSIVSSGISEVPSRWLQGRAACCGGRTSNSDCPISGSKWDSWKVIGSATLNGSVALPIKLKAEFIDQQQRRRHVLTLLAHRSVPQAGERALHSTMPPASPSGGGSTL